VPHTLELISGGRSRFELNYFLQGRAGDEGDDEIALEGIGGGPQTAQGDRLGRFRRFDLERGLSADTHSTPKDFVSQAEGLADGPDPASGGRVRARGLANYLELRIQLGAA